MYVGWADDVKNRDNGKCFICGANDKVVAHHLYSKNKFPSLESEIDNGVTLCTNHHQDFHKSFGYGNNTGFQFLTWLKNISKGSDSGFGYASFFKLYEKIDDLSEKAGNVFVKEIKDEVTLAVQEQKELPNEVIEFGSLKSLVDSVKDQYVKVETLISKKAYDLFDNKCSQLNLTIPHALDLLIHNEINKRVK